MRSSRGGVAVDMRRKVRQVEEQVCRIHVGVGGVVMTFFFGLRRNLPPSQLPRSSRHNYSPKVGNPFRFYRLKSQCCELMICGSSSHENKDGGRLRRVEK
jgi:hypothetical protein